MPSGIMTSRKQRLSKQHRPGGMAKVVKRSQQNACPNADDVISLLLDKAPDSLVKAVVSSAQTGDSRWRSIVGVKFAQHVAHSPTLSRRFFGGLLGATPAQDGAIVIDAFLHALEPQQLQNFFDPNMLKRKGHPIRRTLSGAAFKKNTSGQVFCQALMVFIRRGLKGSLLAAVLDRSGEDFARACRDKNKDFLALVIPDGPSVSDALLVKAVSSSEDASWAVDILLKEFSVPIARFSAPKVISHAAIPTSNFIVAMHARLVRIPPSGGRR